MRRAVVDEDDGGGADEDARQHLRGQHGDQGGPEGRGGRERGQQRERQVRGGAQRQEEAVGGERREARGEARVEGQLDGQADGADGGGREADGVGGQAEAAGERGGAARAGEEEVEERVVGGDVEGLEEVLGEDEDDVAGEDGAEGGTGALFGDGGALWRGRGGCGAAVSKLDVLFHGDGGVAVLCFPDAPCPTGDEVSTLSSVVCSATEGLMGFVKPKKHCKNGQQEEKCAGEVGRRIWILVQPAGL